MTIQVTVRGFAPARTVAAEIRTCARSVLDGIGGLRVYVHARKLGQATACSVLACGPGGVWLVRGEHADPVQAADHALRKLRAAAPSAHTAETSPCAQP